MEAIVAQMDPNEEQRPAIQARGQDVVVTAGAGTGKTRTLVARTLSLLAEGVPLRSIVAITFTNKAAQEMRHRIRDEMRDYLQRPDLSREEWRRWDNAYNDLDAARIGTIHSLCTEILRAHPAEAAIDPRFETLDEGQAGILLAQAIEEAMAWAADDELAVTLYALLGEWSLRSTLEDLLKDRLTARAAFEGMAADPWPTWENQLVPPYKNFVADRRVVDAFAELTALRTDGTLARAEAQGDALAEPLSQLLDQWDAIQAAREKDDWAAVSVIVGELRGNMKLVGTKGAWSPADPKAILKELRDLYEELLPPWARGKINLALDRLWAEATPAMGRLFDQAIAAYDRRKGERQALDFDDLEDKALRLLRDDPAARRRWQQEVSAILVDEYQDTNNRQRDLVNLINGDQGNLFIVGDAKQSIYRFRGAEVAVFREERGRIEAAGGQGYTLAKSYRAHRELIAGLNDLLRPVLGDEEDPDRPWREPFAPLNHHRQEPALGQEAPFVELHLTVGSKGDGALHRAALALANKLAELVEAPKSALEYGHIAILCRASTSFSAYEDAFDQLGLPYLTVAGRGFYDRPEIRDLLNALRALDDPSDDLALVGLLRSPALGFSDADLYDLGRRWSEAGRSASLWGFLQLDSDGPWIGAVDLIKHLHNQSGRIPAATLLKAFLDETHYRAALLAAGYSRPARNVSKLLNDAHTSGLVSVREFLDYVNGLVSGAAREGEARATAGDVIRIMTVHAAKGLEFPVVVIGDVNYDRGSRYGLLLDSRLGAHPPLTDEEGRRAGIYSLLRQREADQESAESDRLLYVAATRAQEKLILNGCLRLVGGGKPGYLKGWLKDLAGPLGLDNLSLAGYDENGDRAHHFELGERAPPIGCTVYEPHFPVSSITAPTAEAGEEFEEWSPHFIEPVEAGRQTMDEATRQRQMEPSQRVWRVIPDARRPTAPAWIVGKLVHEAIRAWSFPGPQFDRWVPARARELGLLDNARLGDAIGRAETLLRRLKAHPLFTELEAAERRLHEVPYSLANEDGRLEQGVIDLLYLKDGLWTVIDFKTDRVKDAAEFANSTDHRKYRRQLVRYGSAVSQLTGRSPRTVLCMLNYAGGIYLEPEIIKSTK